METSTLAKAQVGDELPPLTLSPVTRQSLAVYCGASGDHNPVHVDIDFARAAGLGDVIAHGMLIMAYMGRCLTDWVKQDHIRQFNTRFLAMTRVGNQITCRARVTERWQADSRNFVKLSINAADELGEVKTQGEAVIEI